MFIIWLQTVSFKIKLSYIYWMLYIYIYIYIYIYSDGYDYLNLIVVGFSNGRNWDYTRKLLDGA